MSSSVSLDSVVVRNVEILSADLDEEVVMVHLDVGRYFGLNETGAQIWRMLEVERVVSDLCNDLTSEFDVDLQICRHEVIALLSQMYEEGLIDVRGRN